MPSENDGRIDLARMVRQKILESQLGAASGANGELISLFHAIGRAINEHRS